MKMTVEITPVALARPRINTTNRGRYLPKRSEDFKNELAQLVKLKRPKCSEKPLKVTLHFYKNVKATGKTYGDIDNLVKAVLDALNGIMWEDDSQITELHAYKHKGAGKIEMEVEEK